MSELKPCPFCGKQPENYIKVVRGMASDSIKITVRCIECDIELWRFVQSGETLQNLHKENVKLAESWNRRVNNEEL